MTWPPARACQGEAAWRWPSRIAGAANYLIFDARLETSLVPGAAPAEAPGERTTQRMLPGCHLHRHVGLPRLCDRTGSYVVLWALEMYGIEIRSL